MPNLHLIRLKIGTDTCWRYEEQKGVWFLGDIEGYRYFQNCLEKACYTEKNVDVEIIEPCKTSMQCVILPAASYPPKRPRLKLFERKIFKHDEPEMELIIYGNKPAYKQLTDDFEGVISNYADDLDGHIHIDDSWPSWVLKSSVALVIRGPLSSWDVNKLDSYHRSLLVERQQTYMPDSIPMTKELWPYDEPVAGEYPFVLR